MSEKYYLVIDNEAIEVSLCTESDFSQLRAYGATPQNANKWVVAYTDTPEDALSLAEKHKAGEIEIGEISCPRCGRAHRAIFK